REPSRIRNAWIRSSARAKMPSRDVVRRAVAAIKRRADYDYFFDQLKSPDWIEPLLEEGFFHSPAVPVRDGGYVRFPFWSASRYLARVSSRAPEEVLRAILTVPDTENIRVHEDFVAAALAMPARLAAQVVDKAIRWLESPYQLLLPHKLGELLTHLARGQEKDA